MLKREDIDRVLAQARRIDQKFDLFGASTHHYQLNPPLEASFVRGVEEKYGFRLPEEYFHFITQVGDGGAGPDYGIYPFMTKLAKSDSPQAECYRQEYRRSLAVPFTPRPMQPDDLEAHAIATREAYEKTPERYFVYEKPETEYEWCELNGFFILGTHGCQWDFGIVTAGERRGQVFDYDNSDAYGFVAASFDAFYQQWLDRISNLEWVREQIDFWRGLKRSRKIKRS